MNARLKWFASKPVQRRVQLALFLLWLVLIWPSVTAWRESVPYLVFMSVYTIVMEHFNAWLTAATTE